MNEPSSTSTFRHIETHAQATARRARELYNALVTAGFTEDQAVDLVGASIIGQQED